MTAALNNAINNPISVTSFVTLSTTVTLDPIAQGATGVINCDPLGGGSFLKNLILTAPLNGLGTLLFDFHMNATVAGTISATTACRMYIGTDDSVGNASAYASDIIFTTSGLITPFIRIPCNISDIYSGDNTYFTIKIVNNFSDILNIITVNSLSGFVAVTYLPNGFEE